jgi:hypothetical protein
VDKKIKVIKNRDKFIERHEISLLSLLVEKYPERAKEFLRRLGEAMKAAA